MAHLKKIKTKRGDAYRIFYRLDGKTLTKWLSAPTTLAHAKYAQRKIEMTVSQHKAGLTDFQDPFSRKDEWTLSEFHTWFLQNKNASDRTLKDYDRAFKRLLKCGDVALSKIDPIAFEKSINYLAPATRSILIRSLRAAFNYGTEQGVAFANPFNRIKVPKSRDLPDILTVEEKEKILGHITNDDVLLGYALARWAGLRRKEICSLRWENIDFRNNVINIEGKTGKNQRVPLVGRLKEILWSRRGDGRVVKLHPDSFTHALGKAMLQSGVYKKGSTHIFRHSLGADLIEQGVDVRTIQEILRHSSITTTQIYTQLSTKRLREILSVKNV